MLAATEIDVLRGQLEALHIEISESLSLNEKTSKPVELDQTLQGRVSRGDALQQTLQDLQ